MLPRIPLYSHYVLQYDYLKSFNKNDERRLEASVVQFHRFVSGSEDATKDLGSGKRDSFMLEINGSQLVDFKTNLQNCLEGSYVGTMPVNLAVDGREEANWSKCAAMDKNFRKN